MHIIYTPDYHLHRNQLEIFLAEIVPCFEKPERADIIFKAVIDHQIGPILARDSFPLTPIER